jgi:hypothetical protein
LTKPQAVINLAKDEKEKEISRGPVHRIAHEVYDFADETVAHAEGVPKDELMLECYHKLGGLLAQWAKKLDKIEPVAARPLWLEEQIRSEEKTRAHDWVDLGRESLGFEVENLYFAREKKGQQLSADLLMVSQPKSMWMEDFKELVRFCDALGLDFYVDGFNTKLPGRTYRIVIYKPKDGPHKQLDFRENSLFAIQSFEQIKKESGSVPTFSSLVEFLIDSGRFEDKTSAERFLSVLMSAGLIPQLTPS